jgi:hypothetical protein
LITDPGSLDLEFAGLYDTNRSFWGPATLKYTPRAWRTEFSAGADFVASAADDEQDRDTHFSDHVNLAATTAFRAGERFSWAVAPMAVLFLRGESGARLGGALFARYDRDPHTLSSFASWSGATRASPANPGGTFDLNFGYSRRFTRGWTVYSNIQWERSTGAAGFASLFEGVEYEVNDRLAFDLSAAHYSLRNAVDHQVAFGFTYTLARAR